MPVVYWGIITGLVALVVLFFVCLEILYRGAPRVTDLEGSEDSGEKDAVGRGSKHAA